jgi:hypothetical protein
MAEANLVPLVDVSEDIKAGSSILNPQVPLSSCFRVQF